MPSNFLDEWEQSQQNIINASDAEDERVQQVLSENEPGDVSPNNDPNVEQTVFLSDLREQGLVDETGAPNVVGAINEAVEFGTGPMAGPSPEDQLKEATGEVRKQEQALADFQYNVAVRNQIRQANMARAQASLAVSAGENVQTQRGMSGSAAARLQQAGSFAQGSITSQLGQNLDAFSTSRELGRNVIEAQQGLEDLQFDLAAEARERGEFLQMQQIRQANEAQQFQTTLSLIGTGASIGFYTGGPVGALIGAGIGGISSLFDF